MKNIKIFILVLALNCFKSQAQKIWINPWLGPMGIENLVTYSWRISNPVNYGLHGAVNAFLLAENLAKTSIIKEFKNLTPLIKKYNEKRKFNLTETTKNAAITSAVIGLLILHINDLIVSYRSIRFSKFRYGLSPIKSRIDEINVEIYNIKENFLLFSIPNNLSGDMGYRLTGSLKIISELIKLDNEIIALNYQLDNLDFLKRTFNK
jgi:hypothetical protein